MNDVFMLAVKGCLGGTFVVLFAALSEPLTPKSFAGLFAAAPSIALAALVVTGITKGARADHEQSLAMVFGAGAMVCYCLTAVISVDRLGALRGSIVAFAAWASIAGLAYVTVLAH
jgi:uncharacterized membrane protein (GlpM family)